MILETPCVGPWHPQMATFIGKIMINQCSRTNVDDPYPGVLQKDVVKTHSFATTMIQKNCCLFLIFLYGKTPRVNHCDQPLRVFGFLYVAIVRRKFKK